MNKEMTLQYGKRVFFTVFTQGLLSVAAIVVGFGLPKFFSVEQYSRWQIYYFYVAYVNFLQLGFNDGLVLNLSGSNFDELPWRNIKKATLSIVLYLVALSFIIWGVFGAIGSGDFEVVKLLIFSFIPTILMCIFSGVLLAGNKTYEYNLFCLFIRVVFVAILIFGILTQITNAEFYIIADIFSKIVIIVIFYYIEKKNMTDKRMELKTTDFIKKNCVSGIIIASTVLILGLLPMCGRVVIQLSGNVKEYAMFSFAISMLSIILTFTNAIGTVAFPMLKNSGSGKNTSQYNKLSRLYDEILWICFGLLPVINIFINTFLTEYIAVLDYFVILLAICWPLGKIQSIIYPYYKIWRKEKEFLIISIFSIIFTFVISFLLYGAYGVIGLAWAALIGVLLCNIIMEVYYNKKMPRESESINIGSFIMFTSFIISGLLCNAMQFAIVYGIIIFIHFIFLWLKIKRKEVK